MSEKIERPVYPVDLRRYKDEYYLHIHELGIVVHDADIAEANRKLEKERDELLDLLTEAGRDFPQPGKTTRNNSFFFFLTLALSLMVIFTLTWFAIDPPKQFGEEIFRQVKPLLDENMRKTLESIEKLQSATQQIAGQMKKSAYSNYWAPSMGGNGHYYKVIENEDGVTWKEADSEAKKLGGYLVTITSLAENDFVYKLFIDEKKYWTKHGSYMLGPWIGGLKNKGTQSSGEIWAWVTGETMTFSNWSKGHPAAVKDKNLSRANFFQDNKWISNEPDFKLSSYVVEFDSLN